MIKLLYNIFMPSKNVYNLFLHIWKISENSSAKHYRNNKERLQNKKARERY